MRPGEANSAMNKRLNSQSCTQASFLMPLQRIVGRLFNACDATRAVWGPPRSEKSSFEGVRGKRQGRCPSQGSDSFLSRQVPSGRADGSRGEGPGRGEQRSQSRVVIATTHDHMAANPGQ